ncbi:hypothetical protein I546_3253 [Mycobacterium kansasii 732]|nr:hypothetical protein I546_3253 [Mycobacterium kansasii 732]
MLMPVSSLLPRADAGAVAPSRRRQRPGGFRRIGVEVARPAETARGWLRRFAGRAGQGARY